MARLGFKPRSVFQLCSYPLIYWLSNLLGGSKTFFQINTFTEDSCIRSKAALEEAGVFLPCLPHHLPLAPILPGSTTAPGNLSL